MTNNIAYTSQYKAARVAGFMFLFILISSTFYGVFILSKVIVTGNVIATANNILANDLLFRISIIYELIVMSVGGIVLALALYIILKPVNKNLALLALYLKLTEAILIAVIALASFIALQILKGQASLKIFEPEQVQAIAGLFINSRVTLSAIPMLFLGMNFTLFFYLLFKSKYVPGIFAVFGIISYLLIFIFALFTILAPQYETMVFQAIFWGPSIVFELIIGIWLLSKGINAQH